MLVMLNNRTKFIEVDETQDEIDIEGMSKELKEKQLMTNESSEQLKSKGAYPPKSVFSWFIQKLIRSTMIRKITLRRSEVFTTKCVNSVDDACAKTVSG